MNWNSFKFNTKIPFFLSLEVEYSSRIVNFVQIPSKTSLTHAVNKLTTTVVNYECTGLYHENCVEFQTAPGLIRVPQSADFMTVQFQYKGAMKKVKPSFLKCRRTIRQQKVCGMFLTRTSLTTNILEIKRLVVFVEFVIISNSALKYWISSFIELGALYIIIF